MSGDPVVRSGYRRVRMRSPRALGGAYVLSRLLIAAGPLRAIRQRRMARKAGGATAAARLYREIWAEAAGAVGAECIDEGQGRFRIGRGGTWTAVERQTTELDDAARHAAALDKAAGHALLAGAGVTVPEHLEYRISQLPDARRFLSAVGDRCVVKAAAGTGAGWGVTCAITDAAGLRLASLNAARYSDSLLIERQLPGDMYRLLLLDGELIDVVRRGSPHVAGDGRSSVAALIETENRRRIAAGGGEGLQVLRIDLDCLLTLRAAGRTLRSVPAAGEQVQVKTSTSENRPDENETVRTAPHAALVSEARAAAAALGLRLAGVDIVTPDLARPLADAGGAIVEVNAGPGLRYHYQVADRERATRVAVPILHALLG